MSASGKKSKLERRLSKKEAEVLHQVMLAASKRGWRVFRNNVGFDPSRRIHYGLHKGSGDLIGWRRRKIRPEDVGKTIAQFVSLECKRERGGVLAPDQQNWHEQVKEAGGHSEITTGELSDEDEDADRQIEMDATVERPTFAPGKDIKALVSISAKNKRAAVDIGGEISIQGKRQ